MKVAVGFNPRLAAQSVRSVTERRLNAGVLSNAACVATRRQIVWATVIRGFKPAATITASLREAPIPGQSEGISGFVPLPGCAVP